MVRGPVLHTGSGALWILCPTQINFQFDSAQFAHVGVAFSEGREQGAALQFHPGCFWIALHKLSFRPHRHDAGALQCHGLGGFGFSDPAIIQP